MSPKSKPAAKKAAKKPAPRQPARKTAPRRPAARRPAAPRAAASTGLAAGPERVGVIEVGGRPATVIGNDVTVGQTAPHFTVQVGQWAGLDTWAEVDPLAATAGQVRILAAVPSLDTNVCDMETRRFNEAAAALGEAVRIITVSMDLPIAQKRWCGAAGVERVAVVSDHVAADFGVKYGVLIKERRWLRRAVFVVDAQDVLRYVVYLPRLGDQPDYDAVLAAARALLPG